MSRTSQDILGILLFLAMESVLFVVFRYFLGSYGVNEPLRGYMATGGILGVAGLLYLAACLLSNGK